MNPSLDKFLVLSGLIASVILLFFSITLIGFFFPGYSHINDSISRLGAPDSPVSLIANLSFSLSGIFMLLFGIGLLRISGKDFFGKIGSVLIIIAGICGILVGIFPGDPPGVGASINVELHRISAILSGTVGLLAITFLGIYEFRRIEKKERLILIVIPLLLIPSLIMGTLFTIDHPLIQPYYGLSERISIGLGALLISLISVYLYKKEFINNHDLVNKIE